MKRQIWQQPAQHVQEHCIILILRQKHLEKDTQIRGKVHAGSETAQTRELGGRSGWMVGLSNERSRNMAGKNFSTKVEKHWEVLGHMLNLNWNAQKGFLEEWVYALILYPGHRKLQGATKERTWSSFLGHPSIPIQHGVTVLQLHLKTSPKSGLLTSLKVAHLPVTSLSGRRSPAKAASKSCILPEPARLWHGKGSPLMPLPAAQGSGQVCQCHTPLQNRLSAAFHLHLNTTQLLTASFHQLELLNKQKSKTKKAVRQERFYNTVKFPLYSWV